MDNKNEIWSTLFRLDSKAFKPRIGYVFDGRITTDGVSVSIYFMKIGHEKGRRKPKRKSKVQLKEEVKNRYFDRHLKEIKQCANFVVIDPNKDDLLFIKDKFGNKMRYTRTQRRKEVGTRKYSSIIRELRANQCIDRIESDVPTHKTMDKECFLEYIRYCKTHERELSMFYKMKHPQQIQME